MASVKTGFGFTAYNDDLGGTIKNLGLKFGGDIPDEIFNVMGYESVEGVCNGDTKIFKPRRFQVTTTSGNKYLLPIKSEGEVLAKAQQLLALDIVACLDLKGERWSSIPPSKIGTTYAKPKYSIPDSKNFIKYNYSYNSTLIGAITVGTIIEETPTGLATCQLSGLDSPEEVNENICSRSPVKPRRFTIQALSNESAKVARQAIVSTFAEVKTTGQLLGACAWCLSYKGESATNLGLLIETVAPPAP